MTREKIEDIRFIVIPFVVNILKGINYEGQGDSDGKEFIDDFNVIFDLAIKALEQEPILDKINKMKSEIASSLEFWDYSPNNNPLARDILETVTHFWGDIREVEE